MQSGGLTTVSPGATLSMNTTLNGGELRGSGTVRKLANHAGIVAPGGSPGTLTIQEDFTQAAGGTLSQEIAGPLETQFDRLVVGGIATLAGTLAITNDASYTPAPLSSYRLVQAAARLGTFATLTGAQVGGTSYTDDYLPDGARLCFGSCVSLHALAVELGGSGGGTVTSDLAGRVLRAGLCGQLPRGLRRHADG